MMFALFEGEHPVLLQQHHWMTVLMHVCLKKTAHPARKYPLQEAEGAILPTERHREQKRQLSFLEVLASNCTVMKKAGIIRIPIRHLM